MFSAIIALYDKLDKQIDLSTQLHEQTTRLSNLFAQYTKHAPFTGLGISDPRHLWWVESILWNISLMNGFAQRVLGLVRSEDPRKTLRELTQTFHKSWINTNGVCPDQLQSQVLAQAYEITKEIDRLLLLRPTFSQFEITVGKLIMIVTLDYRAVMKNMYAFRTTQQL